MINTSVSKTAKAFILLMMINYMGQPHDLYAGLPKQILISAETKNVSCNGKADGSIALLIRNAVDPIKVQWSNGSKELQLVNVMAGDYNVTITDANGNVATQTIHINEPEEIEVRGETFSENCSSKDAAIKVQVSGGVKPYLFQWSNGSNNKSLENIQAGDYALQIIDANGCIKNVSYNVERTRDLNVSVFSFNPICSDEASGLIDLEVKGGWAPYNYTWSNGAITEDVSGLAAGNYSVWVKDNNGCSTKLDVTLINPEPIKIEATVSDADEGQSNGKIELNVQGGSGNYNYIWSTLEESATIKNLEEGVYAVRVSDVKQCVAADYFTIHEKSGMEIKGTVFNNLCKDDFSGIIDVTVTGGAKPYSYQWSTGDETEDLKSLEAGLYLLIVTDANHKQVSKTFTVKEAEGIHVFATVKDESAYGKNDGIIALEAIGGASPYTAKWNTGVTGSRIINLASGLYTVTIVDNNQCETTHEVMVATEVYNDESALSSKMMRTTVLKENNQDMSVFPNPFEKSFSIRFMEPVSNILKIELYATDGKLMEVVTGNAVKLSANQLTVSNIGLPKGNYFVKVTTAEKTYSKIVTKNL